jgi:hypothetical protein
MSELTLGFVSLQSRVQVGEDVIEIFDDGLLEWPTLKEPQTMQILLSESNDV